MWDSIFFLPYKNFRIVSCPLHEVVLRSGDGLEDVGQADAVTEHLLGGVRRHKVPHARTVQLMACGRGCGQCPDRDTAAPRQASVCWTSWTSTGETVTANGLGWVEMTVDMVDLLGMRSGQPRWRAAG